MVLSLLEAVIHAPFVDGISAGASNTANYISNDGPRARESFTDFAADPNFGNLRTFLRGKGLFHAEYIYERAGHKGMPLEFDWTTYRNNPAQLRVRVGGFDDFTGETVWWGREDTPTMADLMRRVRASSTMPIIMPPVEIDGRTFVDGALGTDGGVPISIAEELGYERFLVVLTR